MQMIKVFDEIDCYTKAGTKLWEESLKLIDKIRTEMILEKKYHPNDVALLLCQIIEEIKHNIDVEEYNDRE